MRRLVRILLLAGCVIVQGDTLFATTYYVDYSSGNDGNNGTSKASPWQNAPGMQTCSSVCNSTTIKAGDSIILKGGVTWPNASFMWNLPGGSSGSPVYVGVDKTWYTGGSWARPILNAGGVGVTNNDTMFWVNGWVTFDNFEVTGFYWDNTVCASATNDQCMIFSQAQQDGGVFENLYIHGWTHAGTSSSTNNWVRQVFNGQGGAHSLVHDCMIDGSDVAGDHSVTAFFGGPVLAYNNFIRQVSSGFIVNPFGVGVASYHDNVIEDVGPAYCNMPTSGLCTHENGFEDNGDIGLYFYNNVVANVSLGLALWIAPNPAYTAYLWNNVIYAVHDNQILDNAAPVYDATYCSAGESGQGYCNNTGSFVYWNNTIQCGDDSTQYDQCQDNVGGSNWAGANYQNNHFITATTASGCAAGAVNCTFAASNIVQTQAIANGQGFNSSQTYAFSPTKATNATVGAGSNLTALANGNLTTLASDTTYACAYGAGSQPSCPARANIGRQSTGAWNAGAYQSFGPAQPTNLTHSAK